MYFFTKGSLVFVILLAIIVLVKVRLKRFFGSGSWFNYFIYFDVFLGQYENDLTFRVIFVLF